MPKTGHVLSLPQPGAVYGAGGEMWAGYCNRVQLQCGAPPGQYTAQLLYLGDGIFKDIGGFKPDGSNWPFAADRFYNRAAYASEEETEAARVAAQKEAAGASGTWAEMAEAYRKRAAERQNGRKPPAPEDVPISS
jgi:hypothetical protein